MNISRLSSCKFLGLHFTHNSNALRVKHHYGNGNKSRNPHLTLPDNFHYWNPAYIKLLWIYLLFQSPSHKLKVIYYVHIDGSSFFLLNEEKPMPSESFEAGCFISGLVSALLTSKHSLQAFESKIHLFHLVEKICRSLSGSLVIWSLSQWNNLLTTLCRL